MSKSDQLRIAASLAGVPVPPKGAKLVSQNSAPARVDRVTTRQLARKWAAASSVHTTSGGGATAPAPESRGSLREEIKGAMER